MRLISARAKGLKGIYSKSGVKEIFIDFTKCMHDIIYIIGQNGSGKTTLLSIFQPLPDSPSMYLDGESGEKELVYSNNDTLYRVLIQYPVNTHGVRIKTNAYFTKTTSDGNVVELNANGTIGSYKEVLFEQFCLDPNFVSLSHLSVEDRGIVEKTPNERKKFVSALLESIEVYNDIYKTLVKRSSVFKAMINSISAKIDSIGNESKLLADKTATENRINSLQQKRESLEHQKAMSKAAIQVIDPTGEIQSKYKELLNSLNIINDNITMIESSLPQMDGVYSLESATSIYLELTEKKHSLQGEIDSIKENIRYTMNIRAEDASAINAKIDKYRSLTDDQNVGELERFIKEQQEIIKDCESLFEQLNISGDTLTTDEFKLGIEVFNNIRDSTTNIKSYASESQIIDACKAILENTNIINEINTYKISIEENKSLLEATMDRINYYDSLIDKMSILENRPNSCNDDNCIFIKNAVDAQNQDPENKKKEQECIAETLRRDTKQLQLKIEELESISKIIMDMNHVFRYIKSNELIINKFPIGSGYEKYILINRISSGDTFNDITTLSRYAGQAALFSEYKNAKEVLIKLEAQYKLIETQKSIIDDLQKEINKLVAKVADIDNYIENKNKDIKCLSIELEQCTEKLTTIDGIISYYKKLDALESEKEDITSKLKIVSENIEKISAEIATINRIDSELKSILNELSPLVQNQNNMAFSLNRLAEYNSEIEIYKSKYDTVELIKKYSSPTKGGIQTVFMQLYMDKTLTLSNELLGMMFGGTLELLPYVINENEFRIPVKNNITNLIVDDISHCSTSEKSMIAMIMSFVLGFHGSREYNIIRLDEIDGGLDQYNRSEFPIVLNKIMLMLEIEQCFIISHSSEADLSNVDIISLTPVSNEIPKGNVIFQL